MNKIIYWVLGILLAALLLLGVFVLLQINQKPPVDAGTSTASQSINDSIPSVPGTKIPSSNTFKVTAQDGTYILVKDFLHNKETVADTVNPGNYYLAGSIGYCLGNGTCPAGYRTPDFTITFNTATEQFSVALLTKPLATTRFAVEKFLMDRLGLHRITLCNLRYFVSVPSTVDSKMAGKNIGFSPCPGAYVLSN